MLAQEQLDFVDIATTSDSHRALVELAAPRCRVVISQKPIADSDTDARAMEEAAEAAGATLQVAEAPIARSPGASHAAKSAARALRASPSRRNGSN
jgi:predicted dehydrogenase